MHLLRRREQGTQLSAASASRHFLPMQALQIKAEALEGANAQLLAEVQGLHALALRLQGQVRQQVAVNAAFRGEFTQLMAQLRERQGQTATPSAADAASCSGEGAAAEAETMANMAGAARAPGADLADAGQSSGCVGTVEQASASGGCQALPRAVPHLAAPMRPGPAADTIVPGSLLTMADGGGRLRAGEGSVMLASEQGGLTRGGHGGSLPNITEEQALSTGPQSMATTSNGANPLSQVMLPAVQCFEGRCICWRLVACCCAPLCTVVYPPAVLPIP